ncbi:hypothetical protein [Brevibacillus sp. NRS-1366]|uniref:hypothetical protein n=1 Tax=Brevibacillus sp. NRS-1366 TaxID=3233899 RepID=UPI003D1FBF3A
MDIYFGQGTATNSGVVGQDNSWVKNDPQFHDFPGAPITLRGHNFQTQNLFLTVYTDQAFPSENPLNKINPKEQVVTGAFHPFGTSGSSGEMFKGRLMANGVIYRANPDGRMDKYGPERPIAVRFSPDGESLYVLDFGKLGAAATTAIPYSGTGALWRISRA